MHYTYRIILSRNSWNDFSYRLTHTDESAPSGIDVFEATVAHDILIRREENVAIVESAKINEDDIISALLAYRQQKQNAIHESLISEPVKRSKYTIHVDCSIYSQSLILSAKSNASTDGYQTHLKARLKDTTLYYTADSHYYPKTA